MSGARVYLNQVPVFRRASRFAPREVVGTPVNLNVATDANGNFTVTALPGGSYVLCAKGTLAEHLLSCQWGARSTHVAIARAQALKGVRLSVRSGVLLKVTVDDSLGRVSSFKNLLLGVLDPGVFYGRAELAGVSGKAATYQLAVPAGRTLHIVTGSRVTLQDSLGRTVLGAQPGFSVTTEPGKETLVNLVTR